MAEAKMTREGKIVSFIDRNLPGLEIGPRHSPTCPKSAGYNVEIIDDLDQAGLRNKFADHGVDINAIEPVDYVHDARSTYRRLTGKDHAYGWIVASYVIERMPDMVRFIQGCDEVLSQSGVLVLAVPDKRFCFDHLRSKSSLAAIIDAYENCYITHSPGAAADYFLNVCELRENLDWEVATSYDTRLIHTLDEAKNGMEAARKKIALDLHAWCFTPSSFRLIIEDLFRLGLIKLREIGYFPTKGNEFFIALGRHGSGPDLPRARLSALSRYED